MGLGRGEYIDAGRRGCILRYLNHSCEPNCTVELWAVGAETRAAVVAAKAVAPGEELTVRVPPCAAPRACTTRALLPPLLLLHRAQLNYGWERAERRMACYCGAPT